MDNGSSGGWGSRRPAVRGGRDLRPSLKPAIGFSPELGLTEYVRFRLDIMS